MAYCIGFIVTEEAESEIITQEVFPGGGRPAGGAGADGAARRDGRGRPKPPPRRRAGPGGPGRQLPGPAKERLRCAAGGAGHAHAGCASGAERQGGGLRPDLAGALQIRPIRFRQLPRPAPRQGPLLPLRAGGGDAGVSRLSGRPAQHPDHRQRFRAGARPPAGLSRSADPQQPGRRAGELHRCPQHPARARQGGRQGRQIATILSNIEDGVVVLDARNRVTLCNRKGESCWAFPLPG